MQTKNLSAKQQSYRKRLLACIHQAPRYRDYFTSNKDAYRDTLEAAFGKRSAAHLSIDQLRALLSFLNNNPNALQVHTQGSTGNNNPKTVPQLNDHITPAQISYIKAQWQQNANNPTQTALFGMIKKLFKIDVIGLHALTKKQASGLINAINKMGQ